jgi:hypothetical protein
MKRATILDQAAGEFALEYDNNLGRKNQMRLDANTYENALREARSFLGIRDDDHDEAGDHWTIE